MTAAQRGEPAHFVTVRLEYAPAAQEAPIPWKRRGRCTCGWQCLSWDPYRVILIADGHARQATQLDALAQGLLLDDVSAGSR